MVRGGKRPGAGRPQTNGKEALLNVLRVTNSEKDFILFSRVKKIDLTKLKKSLLAVFVLLFLFAMPANALTLEAHIEYTVDSARTVAFDNTELQIDKSEFSGYLSDIFYYSNLQALKSGQYSAGIGFVRRLVPFYQNNKIAAYGVQTEDQPNKKYYYDLKGRLIKYEISTDNSVYPYKSICYDSKGNLLNIHLIVSDTESFIFDENKKLIGHWINNQCYDEKGNIKVTRHL